MTDLRNNRALRDLEFCIRSPGLMAATQPWYPADEWFEQLLDQESLDKYPLATLPLPKDPEHFRLGIQFEKLMRTWMTADSGTSLRHANLQVNEPGSTIGEFDFLLERDGRTEHWEVAIKFYIGIRDRTEMRNWVGPNRADTLHRKITRLEDHQLTLSEHPTAIRLLDDLKLSVDRVRCLVKGRLFHPWNDFQANNLTIPATVNPHHLCGWWLTLAAFEQRFAKGDARFVRLTKSLWLSTIVPAEQVTSACAEDLIAFLHSDAAQPATLVALLDTGGAELSRGFVVNDTWLLRN